MSLVGFTLLGSLEAPSLTASASDVPLLVKPNTEFTVAMLASLDVGGGDLRFSSDAVGATQLACEIVDGLDVVWVSTAGLSVATGLTIYVWGDNTGASQPAVGAAFGRDAVWVDSAISSHLTESSGTIATDSAGNRNGTYSGALPTVGADFGQDLNGTTDYVNYGNAALGIATAFTFSLKIKPDAIGAVQQLFTADDTSGAGGTRNWQWRIDSSGKVRIIAFDSGGAIIVNATGALTLSATTEYIVNFVWNGAAYKSYINGSEDLSVASTTNIGDLAGAGFGAVIGARQATIIQDYFNGQLGELDVIAGAFKTADQISIEYDNKSASGSWWIAADAGGAISVTESLTALTIDSFNPSIDFTGVVSVTESLTNLNLNSFNPAIGLTATLTVTESLTNLEFNSLDPIVTLTPPNTIIVTEATTSLTIDSFDPTITFSGTISVTESLTNLDFRAYRPTVQVGAKEYTNIFYGVAAQQVTFAGTSVSSTFSGTIKQAPDFSGIITTSTFSGVSR
jgi:hypothetical protein